MRFGNKAFRTLMDKIISNCDQFLATFCSDASFSRSFEELKAYLLDSFGSYERIDYGTGHELNFIVFLLCLFKMGVYSPADLEATINCVFQRYLVLMRKIQLQYMLEPAGSHGVWGLDDY
mmetsp:Transcript_36492/g.27058  ORF Transcript_36492/g.27058 Transcript_36492/m.27058 type:complete len:120 (+) Transcript_36492:270-629(+)